MQEKEAADVARRARSRIALPYLFVLDTGVPYCVGLSATLIMAGRYMNEASGSFVGGISYLSGAVIAAGCILALRRSVIAKPR